MNYFNSKIETKKKNEDCFSHVNLIISYSRWAPSQIDSVIIFWPKQIFHKLQKKYKYLDLLEYHNQNNLKNR